MSEIAIHNYLQELEKLRHYGGTSNESAIRAAFQNLLSTYAKAKDLVLVAEISIAGRQGKVVRPDGTLKDSLRMDWGYWESKDQYDDLDEEIRSKFSKGYPNDNILFEDSKSAVLIQNGMERARTAISDVDKFASLLKSFVDYERPEVKEFRKAIENFKEDVPKVTAALRESIETNAESNPAYIAARDTFLQLCREVINPAITPEDIREMVIQHILTADIFNTIFDDPYFHRDNNIAHELEQLTNTFFTKDVRQKTLAGIKHYYDTINARAAQIFDHHEKQRFLKVVYETFYKSYSPKKADRLGVVYTPNEIVNFMIESTDYLLQKHFGTKLEDRGVEIMDPAVGTGTFICDLIDHIALDKLEYKYRNELHANEVEILPYYIANLNIEFTYKQKTGKYCEFENLCFVDTLDNYVNLNTDAEQDIFSLTDENSDRIKRQNERKISVIIGNPPYNANQMNENENNKNRPYDTIDDKIRKTFVKYSTAHMTKVYDMYARFYRWAMDRIGDDGVICFVSNNSFINARTFDGFRKTVQNEFQYAYIIDLGGNIRELSGKDGIFLGEKHTIFGLSAMVGIAIMCLIKDKSAEHKQCMIYYLHPTDIRATRDEKMEYLVSHNIQNIPFEHIVPDIDNNWINLVDNDWGKLLPMKDSEKSNREEIFDVYSLGVCSHRDEWVIDIDSDIVSKKIKYFAEIYNEDVKKWRLSNKEKKTNDFVNRSIKWTGDLERHLIRGDELSFSNDRITVTLYRPFVKQCVYYDKMLFDRTYRQQSIMTNGKTLNKIICSSGISTSRPYSVLASGLLPGIDLLEKTQCFPLYRYDRDGNRQDNITDWALREFRQHYQDSGIGKEDIFHYVYGVLHDPAYRKKYEINLKRSLPRLPWKDDFRQWAEWGKALLDLHLGFETAEPYPLAITDININQAPPKPGTGKPQDFMDYHSKPKLKADKLNGTIVIDDTTSISGIPAIAWEYKLGNRSALEWILDQYKEKKPKDPTIAKLFNSYRFADYKEQVIDLLARICTVSVKTMEIVREMEHWL